LEEKRIKEGKTPQEAGETMAHKQLRMFGEKKNPDQSTGEDLSQDRKGGDPYEEFASFWGGVQRGKRV